MTVRTEVICVVVATVHALNVLARIGLAVVAIRTRDEQRRKIALRLLEGRALRWQMPSRNRANSA